MTVSDKPEFTARDLDESTWEDFVSFFERPEFGGCFCMYWEFGGTDEEWMKRAPAQRRERKLELLKEGRTHGILLYDEKTPVAWCQYGHRSYFTKLSKNKTYERTAWEDVWSVTCFCVAKDYRKKGLSRMLLHRAVEHLKQLHAPLIEGYPKKGKHEDDEVWQGPLSLFQSEGFVIHIDHETTPVVRLDLTKKE